MDVRVGPRRGSRYFVLEPLRDREDEEDAEINLFNYWPGPSGVQFSSQAIFV